MNDLDELIRDGLTDATEHIQPLEPSELARRLEAERRDGERVRDQQVRQVAGVAVAAVLILVVAVAGLRQLHRVGPEEVHTAPGMSTTTTTPGRPPWEGMAPGWQELDIGPVPAMSSGIGMAWTGSEVVVAGEGRAFAYDPVASQWRDIELPPELGGGRVDLVWTGDVVVAVETTYGDEVPHAAAWDAGRDAWTDLGDVPQAPELVAALGTASAGAKGPGGRLALLWTGERVLDLSHGAALDPDTGTWDVMPFPADVVAFSALLNTTAVWTGTEAMLVAWTDHPGLAWNATGTEYREVDGPPDELLLGNVTPWSTASVVDGKVVLVAAEPTATGSEDDTDRGRSIALDLATGTWSDQGRVPGILGQEGCPDLAGVVGDRLVVDRCDQRPPVYRSADGEWASTGTPQPLWTCCLTNWVAAGEALVVWSTDADTLNNPDAPYVRAEVWIPPDD